MDGMKLERGFVQRVGREKTLGEMLRKQNKETEITKSETKRDK